MKIKLLKKLTMGLVCLTMATSLLACGSSNNSPANTKNKNISESSTKADSHYPVTITNYNYAGEEIKVTYDKAPERVLPIYQTTVELMLDLGLGDKIIGACGMDNPVLDTLKDQYDKIPQISDKTFTKEQILDMNPDMIVTWKSIFSDKKLGDVTDWTSRGINTFVQRNTVKQIGDYTIDNVINDINDLGNIFNIQDKTNSYVNNMKDRLSVVEDKTSKIDKKKNVLILEQESEGQYRAYGKNDLVGDMIAKAGGENLGVKSGEMSAEDIVAANPDVIVVVHFEDGKNIDDKSIFEIYTGNPAFANVTAVKNNDFIVTGLAETWAGGIRVVDAVERYFKELYPNIDKD
ncbi:ABC transporter substrate-binding protein [Clostridium uliginosum]|uniref:Iron complex transport system substrate-binding protein n=1 Tax=Clostridium uliginosum TaxID=119641 RepID=A0A1I1PUH4_9CLOT|nr:ABC transporter substrate-binding protein [Clostridium uliginosum]SFD13292.1 iron complex transport system substrate-binding protein [Clostridium uliginosum]